MTVVTAHQPNFAPGVSVLEKCLAADACIWLDEVLYSPHGWANRNRLPSGGWLTVPVVSGASSRPINRVQISEHGHWRARAVRSLAQEYPGADWLEEVSEAILRPYRLLVGLNTALLRILFDRLGGGPLWAFQSHLDGGRTVPVVSEERTELRPISVRLAMMVEELGGDVYLSGQSGRNYLDEEPFLERRIAVRYWQHDGHNPCGLALLRREARV